MTHKKLPVSAWPTTKAINDLLVGSERALLQKVVVAAETGIRGAEYSQKVADWLEGKGSTILLREICEPYADYWGNLRSANLIDGIDSAAAKISHRKLLRECKA